MAHVTKTKTKIHIDTTHGTSTADKVAGDILSMPNKIKHMSITMPGNPTTETLGSTVKFSFERLIDIHENLCKYMNAEVVKTTIMLELDKKLVPISVEWNSKKAKLKCRGLRYTALCFSLKKLRGLDRLMALWIWATSALDYDTLIAENVWRLSPLAFWAPLNEELISKWKEEDANEVLPT